MNIGASIKARLLNIAKKENLTFQVVIFRYLHERLLYRLAQSKYRDLFFLKGGSLLYAYENELSRPTKDIDFLGQDVANDIEVIKCLFQEICLVESNDAVWFNAANINAEIIKEEQKYAGVRLIIEAGFDSVKNRIQIDIGFGDIIAPNGQFISYPTLLSDSDPIYIRAYSLETVIAEKFHAMIVLSYANSRMKDFYDIFTLLHSQNIHEETLKIAIRATFQRRETNLQVTPALFESDFQNDERLSQLWLLFLKKNKLSLSVDFKEVVDFIQFKFQPLWQELN